MNARRDAWREEELWLLCACMEACNWRPLRSGEPITRGLSEILRNLPDAAKASLDERYRSPGSVQRKCYDMLTSLPGYPGSPTRGGDLDRRVVAKYFLSRGVAGAGDSSEQ